MDRSGSAGCIYARRAALGIVALCAVVLATASIARAQGTPYLVRDIETNPTAAGVAVRGIGALGDRVLFSGNDGVHGYELWVSDGTEQGTVLVKDILPGPRGAVASSFTPTGDAVFFVLDDGEHGSELWVSDGTEVGTHLVRDVYPGRIGSGPQQLTAVEDLLYFVADDGEHGPELWISDGSEAGTALVADVLPGSTGSNPEDLVAANGVVYFAADDGEHGREPWASDGTPEGTILVADVRAGSDGSGAGRLTLLDGAVYFVADDGVSGNELWRSDAPASGASRVVDLLPGAGGSSPAGLVVAGDLLFFTAISTEFGKAKLWASDGTAAGTYQVSEISGFFGGNLILNFATPLGDTLYFVTRTDDGRGAALWRSDGTEEGTTLVKDLKSFPCSDEFGALVAFGERLLFSARGPGEGDELWTSDGTEAGTERVKDIYPGPQGSRPGSMVVAGDTLFFAALDGLHGRELWKSDGTEDGTVLVRDLLDANASAIRGGSAMSAIAGRALFTSAEDTLWQSDGSEAGTIPLAAASGLQLTLPIPADDRIFFYGHSSSTRRRGIWSYDGTALAQLADLGQFPSGSLSGWKAVGEGLYFGVSSSTFRGGALWRTNEDLTGVTALKSFGTEYPTGLESVRGSQYFSAGDAAAGRELWTTDGTPSGTTLVADLNPGSAHGVRTYPVLGNLGRRVVFSGNDGVHGFEPFLTGGTPGSTRLLRDIVPGAIGSSPYNGIRAGGFVYFGAEDALGYELWRTDGTTAGTERVLDIEPGPLGSDPYGFFRLGDLVLFTAQQQATGRELWRTDGTVEGTVLLADANAGPANGSPYYVTVVGDVAYFLVYGHDRRRELWVTDGTPEGTRLAADVSSGAPSAGVSQLVNNDGQLFFVASDGVHGNELWALTCGNGVVDASEACDDGALNGVGSSCCTGTCALRDGAGPSCDPIEGALVLSRVRVQSDGSGPGDTGRIVVEGTLDADAALPLSVDAGLVVDVRDGHALDQRVEWPAAECTTRPNGVRRCARQGAVATFRPQAGADAGAQRYRFTVSAGALAIAAPSGPPITVVLRTEGTLDRAAAIAECTRGPAALVCRP